MNFHSIGNTGIFIKQLTSTINSALPDKNERVGRFSQRIAQEISKIGDRAPRALFAKSTALCQATSDSHSIDAAAVSGIAQEILGMLQELRNPTSGAVIHDVENVEAARSIIEVAANVSSDSDSE